MFEKEQMPTENNFEKTADFLNNQCEKNIESLVANEPALERAAVLKEHRQIIKEKLEAAE